VLRDRQLLLAALPWFLCAACLLLVFLPCLTGSGFAFRDSGHFYQPGFHWQAEQWAGGSIPAWNDQQGLGSDEVADGSSSVFYPGKLLYLLPVSPIAVLNFYVLGHLLLAMLLCYRLARHWQTSRNAALLAAASYGLGGSVLSLHANLIFLVAAAWLPLGMQQLDRLLRLGQARATIPLATVLALLILGGDPQAALLLMLAGLLLLLTRRPTTLTKNRAGLQLAAACLLAACLSSVQLLPTLQKTADSRRADADLPQSVYQLADHSSAEVVDGLLRRPVEAGSGDLYDFSIPPWRLAELCWPNSSGRLYPYNQRWLRSIGGEDRIWSASLYMGLLVLALACCGFQLRRTGSPAHWLSWLIILAGLASLGSYGLGWLARQLGISGQLGGQDPLGGIYWLLVTCCPGFGSFRYPAKLWLLVALAISLLAAKQLDQTTAGDRGPLARRLALLFGISLALLLTVTLLRPPLLELFQQGRADTLLGPLQAVAAWNDLATGLLQGTVPAALLLLLVVNLPLHWLGPILVSLTILEVTLANHWLVATAPAGHWEQPSPLAQLELDNPRVSPAPTRFFRASWRNWQPTNWRSTSSSDRLSEGVRWDRRTLLSRHQLLTSLASLESRQSIQPRLLAALLEAGRRHGSLRPDGQREPDTDLLRLLGARWLLGPIDWQPGSGCQQLLPDDITSWPENLAIWRIEDPAPFVWLVESSRQVGPPAERWSALADQLDRQLYLDGQLLDLQRLLLLHDDQTTAEAGQATAADGQPAGTVELVSCSANRRLLSLNLRRPAWLVISQSYHPGWRVASRSNSDEEWTARRTKRANFVMTAIRLPAGQHELRMEFGSSILWPGGLLSLTTLLLLLAIVLAGQRATSSMKSSPAAIS